MTGERLGSDEACPHCGAKSGVVPGGPSKYRCALCGGPRVVVVPGRARAGAEAPLLAEAKTLGMQRGAWGVGAGIATALAMLGGVVAVVVASVFDLGVLGWLMVTALALGPALTAGYGFRRVRSLTEAIQQRLDRAEEIVAADIAAESGGISVPELVRRMRVDEQRAYELAAAAEIAGVLGGDVPPAARVRVADGEESDPEQVDQSAESRTVRRH